VLHPLQRCSGCPSQAGRRLRTSIPQTTSSRCRRPRATGRTRRTLMQFRVLPLGALTGNTAPDAPCESRLGPPAVAATGADGSGNQGCRALRDRSTSTAAWRRISGLSPAAWPSSTRRPRSWRPARWRSGDLQHDRRHAPDALPLLQREGALAAAVLLERRYAEHHGQGVAA